MTEGKPVQEVNIEFGDDMSKMFDIAARATYENLPGAVWRPGDSFRGFRGIDGEMFAHQIGSTVFSQGFDGIGTKVEVRERMQYSRGKGASHEGSAHDLLAMVCDDAPRYGLQVITWGSVLDTSKLDPDNPRIVEGMRELSRGMVSASKLAGVVAINGEIAELIGRVKGYGAFNYNWGAGVWVAGHKSRVLTGQEIKPGDALVGLPETGPRSNGMTDIRSTLREHYGRNWHTQREASLGSLTLGQLVQAPSRIYHGFLTRLTGGWDIRREPEAHVSGFAHITGGGQPSKLNTMVETSGLGVTIDDPIEPPEFMKHIQQLAGFRDERAYRKWHMGPGGVIATADPDKVVNLAQEAGFEGAKRIGEITDEPGIRIKNRGAAQDSEWLTF